MGKRKLLLLLCMLLSLAVQGQTATGHLKFKGVPMDGLVDEFVEKIKGNDWQFFSRPDNGSIILIGTFAGYNDCDIHVYPSSKGNVYQVAICLKPEKTWNMLYSEYSKLKDMLTQKYGQPSFCEEKFDSYSEPDNNMKMFYAKTDRCKYSTLFDVAEGYITVSILHAKDDFVDNCCVMISYIDKQNYQEDQSSAMDDL